MPAHAFKSTAPLQAQTQVRTPTNQQRVQCSGTLQGQQRREETAIGDLEVRERAINDVRPFRPARAARRAPRALTYVEILEERKHCQWR